VYEREISLQIMAIIKRETKNTVIGFYDKYIATKCAKYRAINFRVINFRAARNKRGVEDSRVRDVRNNAIFRERRLRGAP